MYFGIFRHEKVKTDTAYRNIATWWRTVTKNEKSYDAHAPTFPSLKEVKDATKQAAQADEITLCERELTSVRCMASSVKVNDTWYPRKCTASIILKTPKIAETREELLEKLKQISLDCMLQHF